MDEKLSRLDNVGRQYCAALRIKEWRCSSRGWDNRLGTTTKENIKSAQQFTRYNARKSLYRY